MENSPDHFGNPDKVVDTRETSSLSKPSKKTPATPNNYQHPLLGLGLVFLTSCGSPIASASSNGGAGGTTETTGMGGTTITTNETTTSSETTTSITTSSTGTTPVLAPKMGEDVMHPGIHLFTNGMAPENVAAISKKIKIALFGNAEAPTCYQGPTGKKAQFAFQTEFIPPEYTELGPENGLKFLEKRLNAITDAGFAVHLLLPVHQKPSTNWAGIDWNQNWTGSTTFMPHQPTSQDVGGPYDVLSHQFQAPVIEGLIADGYTKNISVIYVANEFGFAHDVLLDNSANWGGSATWKKDRAAALGATADRLVNNTAAILTQAGDDTPVGMKFAQVDNSNTGWIPAVAGNPNELNTFLTNLNEKKGVFAYDLYFPEGSGYDPANFTILSSYFQAFGAGRFELGEFGQKCQGNPGQFDIGARTTADDVTGAATKWNPYGINVFGWNPSGQWDGCYAVADDQNNLYPGANDTLDGLKQAAANFIGVQNLSDAQACE